MNRIISELSSVASLSYHFALTSNLLILKTDVQWFAHLGIEKGFLTKGLCRRLVGQLGDDVDILAFGERILDDQITEDYSLVQELINQAYEKAENGETPPENPFLVLRPKKKLAPVGAKPSAEAKTEAPPAPSTPADSAAAADTEESSNGFYVRKDFSTIDKLDATGERIENRKTQPAESSPPEPAAPPEEPPIQQTRQPARAPEPPVQQQPSAPAPAEPAQSFADDSLEALVQAAVDSTQKKQPRAPSGAPRKAAGSWDTVAPAQHQPQGAVEAGAAVGAVVPQKAVRKNTASDAMPSFSMEVSKGFPDFATMPRLSDEEMKQAMVQILVESQRLSASDVHLSAGSRPFIRRFRKVSYISESVLSEKDAHRLNTALLSDFKKEEFASTQDFDYALALDAHHRYRVNLMMHKNGPAGTYRVIPNKVQTLEELGFEKADTIKKLLAYHNGLILVTGPVGSGKTATLAALIDELNRTREDHIISVEAPIEVVQHSNQCQITQREVGPHTKTFHSALKGALRQDPDIIVIGEMRDLETIEMAISASETGHLVIGTMHTQDASTTLNRLLDVFPAAQQTQIRAMVAESLKGILCQRLLPNLSGGISLAYELLLNNTAVANMIRENKSEGLINVIETGINEGMVLMDKSIMALYRENVVSEEVAINNMINRVFINQLRGPIPSAQPVAPAPAKKKGFFK